MRLFAHRWVFHVGSLNNEGAAVPQDCAQGGLLKDLILQATAAQHSPSVQGVLAHLCLKMLTRFMKC